MHVNVDGADQRRIGEPEIDRAAHRIDLPVVELGGLGQALAGLLPAAGAVRAQHDAQRDRRARTLEDLGGVRQKYEQAGVNGRGRDKRS